MVGGRKGRAGGSKRPADPGSCFHGNGGGLSQLSGGRSSQQGLPRPASWGSTRSFGPGAPSFRSGRKGLTAVPLGVSPALQSLWFRSTGPRALPHAYSHPTPGLHSHAQPRRAPRTQ